MLRSCFNSARGRRSGAKPYFGYGGPKPGVAIAKPLLQLPRGFDNSTGGGCFIEGAAGPGWERCAGT